MRTLIHFCLCFTTLAAYVGGAADAFAQRSLRVMTYNIRHGRGTDGEFNLKRTAAVIRGTCPDLVALQEVDRGTQRTEGVDQPAELARLTGMRVAFQKNIAFQGGDYGNAILSRFPICQQVDLKLPSHRKGEQRGALAIQVYHCGRPLWFISTHFDYRRDDSERLASAETLREWLTRQGAVSAILAGDLNAYVDSPTLASLEQSWQRIVTTELSTFPAKTPERQIDYVLVHPPLAWHTCQAHVLDEPIASDHRPLLVVLKPCPAPRSHQRQLRRVRSRVPSRR